MLHEQTKKEVVDALKAGDKDRLKAARNLSAAFTNELVVKGQKPSELLDDEPALAVVKRLAKQRKESIEQFRSGGREELAMEEEKELAYLEQFLPEMMGVEEIEKVVLSKKEESGIEDKSGVGQLIGAVMAELKGKAEGKDVKEVVGKLFD